jgi:ATP-dependent RNA helicase DeaD
MSFSAAHPTLAQALALRGYSEATPVQAAVIDPENDGADLLVSAETGSGKTVAYGLALGRPLLGEAERFGEPGRPVALIVAPTRELALQVQRELVWLYEASGARIVSCVGGMDPRREARFLAAGAHIVVGTPGRLRDHIERRHLDLGDIRAAVLDEADEMLDLGFREDLEFILEATPPERQTLLFSATLPAEIVRLAGIYQKRDARRIDVIDQTHQHADIEYRAVRVLQNEIEKAVVNVLRWYEARGALVFCATREGVRHLYGALTERGFAAVALSGEMGQNERNQALQAVRDGRARVCVATDVAARGIDLPDLGLVVHADLPFDSEGLLHRSGRTGRAGRKGTSVLLVPPSRRRRAESLLAGAGIIAHWSGAPRAEEIHKLDEERLLADPLLTEAAEGDDLEFARRLAAAKNPEELASALIRLYRADRPEPEEVADPFDRAATRPVRPERPTDSVWFRMNVGRRNNADPRWLLPVICRILEVNKPEIGAIRIGEKVTFFEIARASAAAAAHKAATSGDDEVVIEPSDEPPAFEPRKVPPVKKPHAGKPDRKHKSVPPAKARAKKRT